MAVRFSTSGVERRSQLDYWREACGTVLFELDVESAAGARAGFRGEIASQSLDQARIVTVSSQAHAVVRSARGIRRSYCDDFVVNVAVTGRVGMAQQGDETILNPGDFAVYDSARPCRIDCPDPFEVIGLRIPRDMFASRCLLPPGKTLAVARGDRGVGALFAPLVRSLAAQADTLPAETSRQVNGTVIDLLSIALAEVTAGSAPRDMPGAVHLGRARRYITDHLADPDLSPSEVAEALRLSVRYLHLLFHAEGTSPARWIQERRLELACRLLTDSRHADRTVTDIAFGVGFKDASHFSRVFKSWQGLSPREYRVSTAAAPTEQA